MPAFVEESLQGPRRQVHFGHEEYKEMEPARGAGRDPFLARRPAQIDEDGILGPDTQLHPAYPARKKAFEARAARRYQGDDEASNGARFGEDDAIEAELAADSQRANSAAAAATQAAGLPSYDASKGSRARFAALMNERNSAGAGASNFDDLFGEIEQKEQARASESTPWREATNPDAELIGGPEMPTDYGAQKFHMNALAGAFGKAAGPGTRAGVQGGDSFLRPTNSRIRYGEGRNAEAHPTSYYPNSSWAVAPHAPAPSDAIGAGQRQPAAANRRSDRVMGQYWRTFKERSAAGAGFFGSLFGRGMRRANDRAASLPRLRSLSGLARAREAAHSAEPMSDGLDMEVGNRRRRLWGKANRINEGRGGFSAPDYEENLEFKAEQLGYTMEGKVGASIPEASRDDEDADD